MSKHTPGPWTRSYTNYIYQGKDTASKGRLVAICEPTTRTQEDWDQVFANARLIAAAPELCRLLNYMVNNIGQPMCLETRDTFNEAKDLINKLKDE